MSTPTGPDAIVAGIQALHAERAQAAARIAQIDETLAAIAAQALQGTPAANVDGDGRFTFTPPAAAPTLAEDQEDDAAGDPSSALTAVKTRILSALKKSRTPMSPKTLREAIGKDPTTTRQAIKSLEVEGRVVVTGTTATRRVALA